MTLPAAFQYERRGGKKKVRKKDGERVGRIGARREGGRIQYYILSVVPPITNTTFSLKKGGGLYMSIHFKSVLTIHHHKSMDAAK